MARGGLCPRPAVFALCTATKGNANADVHMYAKVNRQRHGRALTPLRGDGARAQSLYLAYMSILHARVRRGPRIRRAYAVGDSDFCRCISLGMYVGMCVCRHLLGAPG